MHNIESVSPRSPRRLGSRRGQSAIEGLLVMIPLIATVLAILDFGQMVFVHQTLSERARNAARYGGLHPTEPDAVRNLILYNRTTPPDGYRTAFWGLTPAMVNVARVHPVSNEDSIVVTISNYQFRFLSLWITGSNRGKPIVASSPVEL